MLLPDEENLPACPRPRRGGDQRRDASMPELALKNTLLRHRLVVLSRAAKRPRLTDTDRGLPVLPASRLRTWADALVTVRPETVLRWHHQRFRLFRRRKPTPCVPPCRIPSKTVAPIRRLAAENRQWGAEGHVAFRVLGGLHHDYRRVT
jgi:hypothetical protein